MVAQDADLPATASRDGNGGPRGSRWWRWVAAAVAGLAVGFAGGFAGGLAGSRGSRDASNRVCAAGTVASRGLPSVVTIRAEGAAGGGTRSGEMIRSAPRGGPAAPRAWRPATSLRRSTVSRRRTPTSSPYWA